MVLAYSHVVHMLMLHAIDVAPRGLNFDGGCWLFWGTVLVLHKVFWIATNDNCFCYVGIGKMLHRDFCNVTCVAVFLVSYMCSYVLPNNEDLLHTLLIFATMICLKMLQCSFCYTWRVLAPPKNNASYIEKMLHLSFFLHH